MSDMQPATVAYLHHLTAISGGETSLLSAWEHLDRSRFRPVLLGPGGAFADAARRLDVDCYAADFPRLRELPTSRGWRKIVRVRALLDAARARLVHGNAPQTNAAAVLAGRAGYRRLIWQQRTLPRPVDRDLERRLPWLADRVICNSRAVARRYGSQDHNVVVIHNGVDTERFRPGSGGARLRDELGVRRDEVAIGIVGNFSPLKNHELFLEAAARIVPRRPQARFVIVGGEVFEENRGRAERIAHLISELDLGAAVQCVGHRDDMPAVMDGLDVLVAAASVEACSRAVIEAMAAGTTVVAADAGGNPELLGRSAGLSFRPGCPISLAEALEATIVGRDLRAAVGRRARQRAVERFRVEDQVRAVEGVYRSLLEHR